MVVDGEMVPFEVADAVRHQVVPASHVLHYNRGEVLAHHGQSEVDQLRRASTREKWGMCEHGLHSLTWHPFQAAQIAEVLGDQGALGERRVQHQRAQRGLELVQAIPPVLNLGPDPAVRRELPLMPLMLDVVQPGEAGLNDALGHPVSVVREHVLPYLERRDHLWNHTGWDVGSVVQKPVAEARPGCNVRRMPPHVCVQHALGEVEVRSV
ncbi:hypothetical protein GALL_473240 [mine drainage metagenome]|uniref:Uncharacterized protein n=1 Tax=mine drainage metagenome TaxID=410659 RepID=A0A1J5PHX1_9ZZZZ